MAEGFENFEGFGAPAGGAEKSQESDEKFSEHQRQNQQASQQAKKEEKKKKQDDDMLASLIVKFLGEAKHTRLFLLISRLIAKNMPSDLILAIIAIIYSPAKEHIAGKFDVKSISLDIIIKDSFSEWEEIDFWLGGVLAVSLTEAEKVLETGLDKDGKIDFILIQLASFCLKEFLEKPQKENANIEKIQDFLGEFWRKLFSKVANKVDRKALKEA